LFTNLDGEFREMSERQDRLHRLLDVGQTLVAELDPDTVLERILEEARHLTGARYAALGVLDEQRKQLERFLTAGVDRATHRAIGELPRGRGVLGVLIEDPRPLRVADIARHPESYGLPPGHPTMRTFLGVPILIREQAWGNLYLGQREGGGEFTQADEDAAVALARWAAIAIENARIYQTSERRREQLERVVQAMEAARDISDAIGSVADLDRVLELIVKRGRALVDARNLLIMLRQGDELVVAAGAGHANAARGRRMAVQRSRMGQVLQNGRPRRVSDVQTELQLSPAQLGVADVHCALLVPMMHRGSAIGMLVALDRGEHGEEFSSEDEQLLRTFAQSAANAVAIKRSVEIDRLRSTIAVADAERARWAHELQDVTLKGLGALREQLISTARRGRADGQDELREAIEQVELEMAKLREIITDLRPSLLDELGLLPAIKELLDRRRHDALRIESELRLPAPDHQDQLPPEIETTVYRLVQEALTNVVKHARATTARVSVGLEEREVMVEVEDDGEGFDTGTRSGGFGLTGLRERVGVAGGTLWLESGESGTLVRARLPLQRPAATRRSLAATEVTG